MQTEKIRKRYLDYIIFKTNSTYRYDRTTAAKFRKAKVWSSKGAWLVWVYCGIQKNRIYPNYLLFYATAGLMGQKKENRRGRLVWKQNLKCVCYYNVVIVNILSILSVNFIFKISTSKKQIFYHIFVCTIGNFANHSLVWIYRTSVICARMYVQSIIYREQIKILN